MARGKRAPSTRGVRTALVEDEEPALERDPIERILERVEPRSSESTEKRASNGKPQAVPAMRFARVVAMAPGKIEIAFRGARQPVVATLAEGVDRELVALAMKNFDAVLVELELDGQPCIVGVIQTRIPRDLVIKADTIRIEAEQELLLRSKTAAVRLRQDGDVELVGSRILALSRGLFRLVGRVLRLN